MGTTTFDSNRGDGSSSGGGGALTNNHIFVGNASNVATDVAVSGEATISNTGVVTLSNAAVIGKVITGFVSGAGTVAATDTILQAIQKLDGNGTAGGGTWSTFTPTVTASGGTIPQYIINSGRYAQIGKIVFVQVKLYNSTGNNGSGAQQINIALPVAASANALDDASFPCGYGLNGGSREYALYGTIGANATTISLTYLSALTGFAGFSNADQSSASNREINIKFSYESA